MDIGNPDLDPNGIYYNIYSSTLIQPTIPPVVGGEVTIITTINGGGGGQAVGPSITFTGGSTGLQFTASSSTISLGGTLVAANGGTGQSSYTKGDLLAASAATTLSKLAVAANDARLTTDSAETTGLKWIAASTGWGNPTGTLARGTYAAYAGQTISNPPTQAEVQALDDAVKLISQTLAGWLTDAFTQKIIKT